jgi:RHS repeat-associated protein
VDFNPQGSPLTIAHPFGETETFTYGSDGHVDTRAFGDGTTLTFTHDDEGRETSRTDGTSTRTIAYGPGGRYESVTGPTGTVDYDYDAAGRLAQLSTPAGAPFNSASVDYESDALGRVTEVTVVVGATEKTTTYAYDALGNITQLTDPESGVTTFTYDAVGRLATRALPNGVTSTWTYDARDRVLSVTHAHTASSTVLASRTFARTLSGEPTRIDREDGSYVELTYDAGNRLASETHRDRDPIGTSVRAISYTYDADGNRATKTTDGVTEVYAYAPGAELTATTASGSPTGTYAYDGQGRTTSIDRPGKDYDLTYEDLLSEDGGYVTSLTDTGGLLAEYEFDGEGRRERVTHNATERRYLIAPAMGDGYESPHAVVDDLGALVSTYVYAGEHAVMRIDATGAITYYLRDSMGTVVGLADTAGASIAAFNYEAFGDLLSATGPGAALPAATLGDFRFQGMWQDPTDLYFVRARSYDGTVGRFTARDPASFHRSAPESATPYSLGYANTFVWGDPLGRSATTLNGLMFGVTIHQILTAMAFASAPAIACALNYALHAGAGTGAGMCAPERRRDDSHVVRLQAQGGNLEASVTITQKTAVTVMQGIAGLESLEASISRSQRRLRSIAFERAKAWVRGLPPGGAPRGTSRTFTNPGIRGRDARVDIEILNGLNFTR